MDGLADIVIDYFLAIMFADGDVTDADYQVRLQESLPEHISPLSVTEREALSEAAKRRLDDFNAGPDKYGYDDGMLVSGDQRTFLAAVASGELYDGLSPRQVPPNHPFTDSEVVRWQRKSIPRIPSTKEAWAASHFGSTRATSNGWLSIVAVRPMQLRRPRIDVLESGFVRLPHFTNLGVTRQICRKSTVELNASRGKTR